MGKHGLASCERNTKKEDMEKRDATNDEGSDKEVTESNKAQLDD